MFLNEQLICQWFVFVVFGSFYVVVAMGVMVLVFVSVRDVVQYIDESIERNNQIEYFNERLNKHRKGGF